MRRGMVCVNYNTLDIGREILPYKKTENYVEKIKSRNMTLERKKL